MALAASFTVSEKREPSIKRKRLHILYLVNDILYHAKYKVRDASICGKTQPLLMNLFGSAASFENSPKHQRKLLDLLAIWEEKGYYSREYLDKLREAAKNASEAGQHLEEGASTIDTHNAAATKLAKSAPYVMPAMHGDPSTPWFDLPAGNLMQHIEPNSTKPINPDMIRPMQFIAGPANEDLVRAVKTLLDDVDTIFGKENQADGKAGWDIDELGQPIILDEITGDVIDGEGYYGWSREFCEKMKKKKKRGLDGSGSRDRSQSRSRSRSSSRGRKRRYSDSDSSGSRPTQRRRSYSSSRSPLRNGHSRSPSPRHESIPRENPAPRPPIPMPPQAFQQQGFNPNFPPPPPPPLPFNGPGAPPYGQWVPPPPPPLPYSQHQLHQWPVPPPPPPPPDYQSPASGNFSGAPPNGPGGWQHGGRGYPSSSYQNSNNGWSNQGRGGYSGRGNYRGNRGW